MKTANLLAIVFTSFSTTVFSHRVLILQPTPSYSHQLPAMGLTEALVKKGHDVFFLSPDSVPGLQKNYTHFDFSWLYQYFHESLTEKGVHLQQQFSNQLTWIPFLEVWAGMVRHMFESDTFQQFLKRVQDEKISFDVVIVESFVIPYGVGLARLLTRNKPVISLATMTGGEFFNEDAIGNIKHLSYSPAMLSAFNGKMSLWERLENWVTHHYISSKLQNVVENSAKAHFRDTYGPDGDAFVEGCWGNISLAMITSNALYYYPRPITPNVIEVGPLHIKNSTKLSKTLQDWLDGAERGVIYFSLGSNMRSANLPRDALSNFLRVFRELPEGYRVLWKWEDDAEISKNEEGVGKSKVTNILTQKWIPQQEVLAHPKVKLFITQGGCQSFQETVHYGVPLVGVPWFGDQEVNVAKMVDAGIGVRLRPQELDSFVKVKQAVEAVLFDKRYAENMKKLSDLSHDFTRRAPDEAVFWVEHVAKHGGAAHLRPYIADTSYFRYFCLDLLSVILSISAVIFYFLWKILKYTTSSIPILSHEKLKSS
ncbi:UDP-glycosyltransferase UGT5 [Bemisia tabaci]|uniref:UDP-glycosyltransferase UGT5 n=1 Tax=Bemisia tabaci TaxID=7038 RepID=UPI003B27C889